MSEAELNRSALKTRVRCCALDKVFHCSEYQHWGDINCNLIHDHVYSEQYGHTQIYCPCCGAWCWMGQDKLDHKDIGVDKPCHFAHVTLAGNTPREHAYMSERERAIAEGKTTWQ